MTSKEREELEELIKSWSFFKEEDEDENVEQITSNGLEIYATEELIAELKDRGFTGELKQVHILSL